MLNISHIQDAPRAREIIFDTQNGGLVERIWRGKGNLDEYRVVDYKFIVDVGGIQHGWHYFPKDGDRSLAPQYVLSAVTTPQPEKPASNARGVIVVPIAARELGGLASLVVSNNKIAPAFDTLHTEIMSSTEEIQTDLIPEIGYKGMTDIGEPVFEIIRWVKRPPAFGKINNPVAAQPPGSMERMADFMARKGAESKAA
jgi:hypothetical protein